MSEPLSGKLPHGSPRPRDLERQLQQLWRQGRRPELTAFLTATGDLSADELVGVLAVDQRERWRSGERVSAETYLEQFPALLEDGEKALELIYGEFLLREELGETPPAAEYLRRFPRFAARLEQQFQLYAAMASSSVPSGAETTLRPFAGTPTAGGEPPTGAPRVPGYTITGELGRGGMGVVYLAHQAALGRRIALKLLRAGEDADPESLTRFRREAEALARLQHPHVVQIHEVGEYGGRAYCALEYVEGGGLDRRWAVTPQPARQVAALVETLARAVQAAHAQGVVHRDLKPANVLLTADGVPKITDFGLAKRLDVAPGDTQSGAIMGTPSYMAPEQAQGQSKAVGPAADVYALGAILYEGLTGRPPFKGESAFETLQQVLSQEPVSVRALQPKAPRDLETICLKCLRKEPGKRYGSALELAEDLRRFQEGKPILARPTPGWERTLKWARRRPAVAAAVVLGILLIAGQSVSMALIAQREQAARAARQDEARAREQAEQEKQVAEAVRDFLRNKLLGQADPNEQADALLLAGGTAADAKQNPTIRELLDRAAAELTPEKIEVQFPNQPAVQAEILLTIGYTYHGVGALEPAITHLTRALDLRQRHFGSAHADTLNTMDHLAAVYRDAGRTAEAIRLLEQLRDKQGDKSGPVYPYALSALDRLAGAYLDAGRTAEAIRLYERVRDERAKDLGPDHRDTLKTLNNLANAYRSAGRFDEAVRVLEQVRDKSLERLGPEHPDTLTTLNTLALAYKEVGRTAEAICLFERVRDKRVERLGADHPRTLTTLNNLGLAYRAAGRTAEAVRLYEQVRDMRVEKLGANHPATLKTLNNLANAYGDAGRHDEAVRVLEQVRDKKVEILGAEHPETLVTLHNLAAAYRQVGRVDEAIRLFEGVRDKRAEKLGATHPHTLLTLYNLAGAYEQARRFDLAVEAYRTLLEKERRRQPANATRLANVLVSLGSSLLKADKQAEAEPPLRECLALRTQHEPDAWSTFNAKSLLGDALLGQRKYAEAEPLLREGYEGMKQREAKIPARGKVALPEALERLVQLYDAWEKKEQGDLWRKELDAVRARRKKSPP